MTIKQWFQTHIGGPLDRMYARLDSDAQSIDVDPDADETEKKDD